MRSVTEVSRAVPLRPLLKAFLPSAAAFLLTGGTLDGLYSPWALAVVSAAGLAGYKSAMDGSFVMKDLNTFKKWPATMEHWDRMFTEYPKMVVEIFDSMFVVDGKPQLPLMKRIMPIVKQRGLVKLGKEVLAAIKAL